MSDHDVEGRVESTNDALLAERLVELADTLVADYDVVDVMDRLVHFCVELLPIDSAGLLLVNQRGTLEVLASTSEATRIVEVMQVQSEAGGGPCVDCVRTGNVVVVEDLAAGAAPWPRFAARASSVGFRAVHAVPMRLRDEVIGGLNLFGTRPMSLSSKDTKVAQALADVATIGILQQRSIQRATLVADQLQAALSTRVVIEQAKGVLAEFGKVDMDGAFHALRAFARSGNLKLGAVANAVVQRTLSPSELMPRRSPTDPA